MKSTRHRTRAKGQPRAADACSDADPPCELQTRRRPTQLIPREAMPRVSHERRAFFYPSKIPGYPNKGVDAPPGPLLSRVTLPGPVGILGLLCYSVYSDRLGALLNGAKFPREKVR